MNQPAGWYPSTNNPGNLQWWTGEAWTNAQISDFSSLNIHKLSKNDARARVGQLIQKVHELEQQINTHGVRDAAEIAAWRELQEQQIAEQQQAAEEMRSRAAATLAEAEAAAGEAKALAVSEVELLKRTMLEELEEEANELRAEVARLESQLVPMRDAAPLQEVGFFDYEHPAESSTSLATELEVVRSQIKNMIREKKAATAISGLTFEGSAAKGKQLVNNLTKVLLRAYNAEAENAVKATRAGNLDTAQTRLSRAADQIATNGQMVSMRITSQFHRLRLKEIELAARHLHAVQQEKELERERREQLREQRKAEQELKKEQDRLEKERGHYLATIAALENNGDADGAERVREKLADVDRAIADVDYRSANIRAGYVYVISNIGSFGADVVKIGMTRRLDPMDRVRELGDASVPFRFDVHALFFADDAVAVEALLHKEFADARLNRVNHRREYFRVTPQDVLEKLKEHRVEVLEFTLEPEALEHRESLAIAAQLESS